MKRLDLKIRVAGRFPARWEVFCDEMRRTASSHLSTPLKVSINHAYDLFGMDVEVDRAMAEARRQVKSKKAESVKISHGFCLVDGVLTHSLTVTWDEK